MGVWKIERKNKGVTDMARQRMVGIGLCMLLWLPVSGAWAATVTSTFTATLTQTAYTPTVTPTATGNTTPVASATRTFTTTLTQTAYTPTVTPTAAGNTTPAWTPTPTRTATAALTAGLGTATPTLTPHGTTLNATATITCTPRSNTSTPVAVHTLTPTTTPKVCVKQPCPENPVVIRRNVLHPGSGQKAAIAVQLDHSQHVCVRIYSQSGKLVKVLEDRQVNAGTFETAWAGVNQNGAVVRSGVYVVEIQTETFTEKRKLVVVR